MTPAPDATNSPAPPASPTAQAPATSPPSAASPASLYGAVSLTLGTIALVTAVLSGYAGIALPILCGALAVTLAATGLTKRRSRVQCTVALITGTLGLLYPAYLLTAFGG